MEVEDEAEGDVEQFHVAQQLGFVDSEDALDRFDFDQQTWIDQQIEAERLFALELLVSDDDGLLILDSMTAQLELHP